jgi:hypothetical protein
MANGSLATRAAESFSPAALTRDHRPAAMKVDTDGLSIHRGLLLFVRGLVVRNPESGPTRFLTGSGRPRSFIASVLARCGVSDRYFVGSRPSKGPSLEEITNGGQRWFTVGVWARRLPV